MKILITGSNGFIGSNLIKRLHDSLSVELTCVDYGNGVMLEPEVLKDLRLHSFDCGDVERMTALGPHDVIIHLAGETRVEDSFNNPVPFFENNVAGTGKLLYAASKMGVKKFIFFSTCGALFNTNDCVKEDSLPAPISIYGGTKLAAENLVHTAGIVYGFQTCCLRPTNIFGPYSWHKKSLIAAWCRSVLDGVNLIITGDGSQTRDFVPVEKVIDDVLELLPIRFTMPRVLHVCSGRSITIEEMFYEFNTAVSACGFDGIKATIGPSRKEVRNVRASSFIHNEKIEDLRPYLTSTMKWFEDYAIRCCEKEHGSNERSYGPRL